jgi:hypothetical protein
MLELRHGPVRRIRAGTYVTVCGISGAIEFAVQLSLYLLANKEPTFISASFFVGKFIFSFAPNCYSFNKNCIRADCG